MLFCVLKFICLIKDADKGILKFFYSFCLFKTLHLWINLYTLVYTQHTRVFSKVFKILTSALLILESKLKAEEKPLELAKARILSLERGIERRYLKPPFRLEWVSSDSCVFLCTWRVNTIFTSNAQILICCVCWMWIVVDYKM